MARIIIDNRQLTFTCPLTGEDVRLGNCEEMRILAKSPCINCDEYEKNFSEITQTYKRGGLRVCNLDFPEPERA